MHAWRLAAPPAQVKEITLNGGAAQLLVYNALIECPDTAEAIIPWLAQRYNRAGDFMCGYGRTGRLFMEAGKSFVMSDYNAECIGYIAEHVKEWAGEDTPRG